MIPSLLYRIAYCLAMALPVRVSYAIAVFLADIFFVMSAKDRRVIIKNTRIVCGALPEREVIRISREVLRNFAKYLVDFFRFERIDDEYIKKMLEIKGREHIDAAIEGGRGAILLSAHIGNWELGGALIAALGYDISVVALPHSHRGINDFFRRQRGLVKMKAIEIGSALKGCYTALKNNGLLALLGDRDFTKNGQEAVFFGQKVSLPVGPAALSRRMGSAIVPCFLVRNPDDRFTMHVEKPIYPDPSLGEEDDTGRLMGACAGIIESYVKRFPTQWYVFKDIWNGNGKDLRPDTIV